MSQLVVAMANRPKHSACRSQLAGDAFRCELDRQQAGSYEELRLHATQNWYIANNKEIISCAVTNYQNAAKTSTQGI
jgi:hypothetical protein